MVSPGIFNDSDESRFSDMGEFKIGRVMRRN